MGKKGGTLVYFGIRWGEKNQGLFIPRGMLILYCFSGGIGVGLGVGLGDSVGETVAVTVTVDVGVGIGVGSVASGLLETVNPPRNILPFFSLWS